MLDSSFSRLGWTGCILSGLFAVGCAETPTAATGPEIGAAFTAIETEADGPSPLVCPAAEARSAAAMLGKHGGTVAVDGHLVSVPPGALDRPTRITITRPASEYLEVELRANDYPTFEFYRQVTVTLSYAGCEAGEDGGLGVWHVADGDRSFLESMGGEVDPVNRTVTFLTSHFSYFMVAT